MLKLLFRINSTIRTRFGSAGKFIEYGETFTRNHPRRSPVKWPLKAALISTTAYQRKVGVGHRPLLPGIRHSLTPMIGRAEIAPSLGIEGGFYVTTKPVA
jgi:hypothetical protein